MFQFAKGTIIEKLNYNQCHDFTYDNKNYYFTTNTNYIDRYSEDGILEEKIHTSRNFHTITFDEQHNCFWGAVRQRSDILYQLDRDFKETDYLQTRFQSNLRYPINFLSYCNSDNLFLIISNFGLNVVSQDSDAKDNSSLSLAFRELHSTLYGACADYGIELSAVRRNDTMVLTAANSSHSDTSESILLPADFQFKSVALSKDQDTEGNYSIKVFGTHLRQAMILEYTLHLSDDIDKESNLEHAFTLSEDFPTLTSDLEMDSSTNVPSISILKGQICVQNPCCKPPSSCCPNNCQPNRCCKDKCQRCCHCVSIEILETIACQEAALAHILNAEGEKIQRAVKDAKTMEELLKVNDSVQNTIVESCHLELVLYSKLQCALSGCKGECKCNCEPHPPCPCDSNNCK